MQMIFNFPKLKTIKCCILENKKILTIDIKVFVLAFLYDEDLFSQNVLY